MCRAGRGRGGCLPGHNHSYRKSKSYWPSQLPRGPHTSDSSNDSHVSGKVIKACSFIYSFTHSFIQRILTEHLLCVCQALFQALRLVSDKTNIPALMELTGSTERLRDLPKATWN